MILWSLLLGVGVGAVAGFLLARRGARRGGPGELRERDELIDLIAEGVRHLAGGEPKDALEALQEAAGRKIDDPRLYLAVGDLLRDQGRAERATLVHRSLLARADLPPAIRGPALLSLARDQRALGNESEAEACLADAARHAPKDQRPLVELGLLLEGQGRWDEALEMGRRVAALDRERGRIILARRFLMLALRHLADGDLGAARRALDSALQKRPGLTAAEIARGDLLFQRGETEAAARIWEEVLTREPGRAHLLLERLEEVHARRGRPEETRRLADTLAGRRPGDWRLQAWLADAALAAEDGEEADRRLERLERIRPGSPTLDRLLWRRCLALGFDPGRAERRARPHPGALPWVEPYRCRRCGRDEEAFLWRCPGCRGWDSFE